MKKITITLAVLLLGSAVPSLTRVEHEFDYEIKFPGEYHHSCPTCAYNKTTKMLHCICKSYWDRTVRSGLDMATCSKPVHNCHGRLHCGECEWQEQRRIWKEEQEKYGHRRRYKDEL